MKEKVKKNNERKYNLKCNLLGYIIWKKTKK